MSRELFKSMIYKNGKVYTRQCSNNVSPKYFYSEENEYFTKLYNKLGEINFEKWFLTNGLMLGNVTILKGCNKTLKRLYFLSCLLWGDKNFINLYDKKDVIFWNSLSAKTPEDKEMLNIEHKKIEEDIKKYISSFYDTHNSKYKGLEKER